MRIFYPLEKREGLSDGRMTVVGLQLLERSRDEANAIRSFAFKLQIKAGIIQRLLAKKIHQEGTGRRS